MWTSKLLVGGILAFTALAQANPQYSIVLNGEKHLNEVRAIILQPIQFDIKRGATVITNGTQIMNRDYEFVDPGECKIMMTINNHIGNPDFYTVGTDSVSLMPTTLSSILGYGAGTKTQLFFYIENGSHQGYYEISLTCDSPGEGWILTPNKIHEMNRILAPFIKLEVSQSNAGI